MAASTVIDELTCALCLELYTEPRLLPCFHTFCKICIEQLIQKSESDDHFNCPLCRSTIKHTKGVEDFPSNIYIQTQLHFNNSDLKCDICELNENVHFRCLECEQFLCGNCSKIHQKIKSCKDHEIVEYTGTKSGTPTMKMQKRSFCAKHPEEILRFFCTQCEIPVCRDCKHTSHEGHKSEDVHDRLQYAVKWIESYCGRLDFEISCLNNQKSSMTNIKALFDKNTDCIDKLEEDLCNKIRGRCAEIKLEMKRLSEETDKSISSRRIEIESNISRISCKKKYIEQTLQHGSDSDIMQLKSQFVNATDSNINTAGHLELKFPKFSVNKHLSLPMPSLGQVHDCRLKLGFTLILRNTFLCNTTNKLISAICLESPDTAVVSFQSVACNTTSQIGNTIVYDSDGNEKGKLVMSPQLDLAIDSNSNFYYFNDRIGDKGGITTCKVEAMTTGIPNTKTDVSKSIIYSSDKPIAMSIFDNDRYEDLVVFDIKRNFQRFHLRHNETENVLPLSVCIPLSSHGLVSPMKIACSPNDDLWVTDPGAEKVFIFDETVELKFKFDASQHLKLPNKFKPNGICMYNSYLNFAIIADPVNNCIFTVSYDGQYWDVILDHRHGLESPTCVACKGDKLWVSDKTNRIRVFEIQNKG